MTIKEPIPDDIREKLFAELVELSPMLSLLEEVRQFSPTLAIHLCATIEAILQDSSRHEPFCKELNIFGHHHTTPEIMLEIMEAKKKFFSTKTSH